MSIAAVARQAGVSPATVSRVFNTPGTVAAATRARVEAAAAALAYTPNLSAQTLRTRRNRSLGVLLPTLLNPVFAEYLDGVADAASEAGYAIVPVTTDYQEAREAEALARLVSRGVDGLILTVANAGRSALLARVHRLGLPHVFAYNRHAQHPCVSVDGEAALRELVARVHGAGHARIAMVSGTLAASDRAQQRRAGYRAGMRALGLRAQLIEVPFMDSAVDALTAVLRGARRPSALLCSNDLLAVRSLRAAALAGLRVPADLAVLGFDGIALGRDLVPTLASVAQPNREIGLHSARWLIDCLGRGAAPEPAASVTLPHAFRPGESFAAAGVPSSPRPSSSRSSSSRRSSSHPKSSHRSRSPS